MINLQLIIWINILYIFGFSPMLYKNSRIKYSTVPAIGIYDIKISYYRLYTFLGYMIVLLNLLMIYYTNTMYPLLSKYWYYILPIVGFINMYIMTPKPIRNDGTFKSQPKMLKRKNLYKAHILLILVLISSIIIELYNIPYFGFYQNKKLAYIGISRIITLIIVIYMTTKQKNMSNCKYNLPKSWQ